MLIYILPSACNNFGDANGCFTIRQSTSSPGISSTSSRGTSRCRQTHPAISQSACGRPTSIHFDISTSGSSRRQTVRQNPTKIGVGIALDVLYKKSSKRRSRVDDIIETHANASNRIISTVSLKDSLITQHPQLLRGCNDTHDSPPPPPTLDNHLHVSDSIGASGRSHFVCLQPFYFNCNISQTDQHRASILEL